MQRNQGIFNRIKGQRMLYTVIQCPAVHLLQTNMKIKLGNDTNAVMYLGLGLTYLIAPTTTKTGCKVMSTQYYSRSIETYLQLSSNVLCDRESI